MDPKDGAAGIAFGAMDSRDEVGGQRADSLVVTIFHSCRDLPAETSFAGRPTSWGMVSFVQLGRIKDPASSLVIAVFRIAQLRG